MSEEKKTDLKEGTTFRRSIILMPPRKSLDALSPVHKYSPNSILGKKRHKHKKTRPTTTNYSSRSKKLNYSGASGSNSSFSKMTKMHKANTFNEHKKLNDSKKQDKSNLSDLEPNERENSQNPEKEENNGNLKNSYVKKTANPNENEKKSTIKQTIHHIKNKEREVTKAMIESSNSSNTNSNINISLTADHNVRKDPIISYSCVAHDPQNVHIIHKLNISAQSKRKGSTSRKNVKSHNAYYQRKRGQTHRTNSKEQFIHSTDHVTPRDEIRVEITNKDESPLNKDLKENVLSPILDQNENTGNLKFCKFSSKRMQIWEDKKERKQVQELKEYILNYKNLQHEELKAESSKLEQLQLSKNRFTTLSKAKALLNKIKRLSKASPDITKFISRTIGKPHSSQTHSSPNKTHLHSIQPHSPNNNSPLHVHPPKHRRLFSSPLTFNNFSYQNSQTYTLINSKNGGKSTQNDSHSSSDVNFRNLANSNLNFNQHPVQSVYLHKCESNNSAVCLNSKFEKENDRLLAKSAGGSYRNQSYKMIPNNSSFYKSTKSMGENRLHSAKSAKRENVSSAYGLTSKLKSKSSKRLVSSFSYQNSNQFVRDNNTSLLNKNGSKNFESSISSCGGVLNQDGQYTSCSNLSDYIKIQKCSTKELLPLHNATNEELDAGAHIYIPHPPPPPDSADSTKSSPLVKQLHQLKNMLHNSNINANNFRNKSQGKGNDYEKPSKNSCSLSFFENMNRNEGCRMDFNSFMRVCYMKPQSKPGKKGRNDVRHRHTCSQTPYPVPALACLPSSNSNTDKFQNMPVEIRNTLNELNGSKGLNSISTLSYHRKSKPTNSFNPKIKHKNSLFTLESELADKSLTSMKRSDHMKLKKANTNEAPIRNEHNDLDSELDFDLSMNLNIEDNLNLRKEIVEKKHKKENSESKDVKISEALAFKMGRKNLQQEKKAVKMKRPKNKTCKIGEGKQKHNESKLESLDFDISQFEYSQNLHNCLNPHTPTVNDIHLHKSNSDEVTSPQSRLKLVSFFFYSFNTILG